jgi:hypothetical protein
MALSSSQSPAAKARFLRKFALAELRQPGWKEVALQDAVIAATRRGHLVRRELTPVERGEVRRGWQSRLTEVADTYVRSGRGLSRPRLEDDIMRLRALMNNEYGHYFWKDAVRTTRGSVASARARCACCLASSVAAP